MDFTEMYRINDISYTIPYEKNNAGSPYLVVGRKGGKYGIRNDKGAGVYRRRRPWPEGFE